MGLINLKKLIKKQKLDQLIDPLIKDSSISLIILNKEQEILYECNNHTSLELNLSYPLLEENQEIIGWVRGTENITAILPLLNYLIQQEYEKKLIIKDALEKYEEINFFYSISNKIANCLSIEEISQLMTEEIKFLIEGTEINIFLYHEESRGLQQVILKAEGDYCPLTISASDGILGYVFQSGKPEIINDVKEDLRYIPQYPVEIRSMICAPLITPSGTIGVVAITHNKPTQYNIQDLKLFTALTSQASIAIKNALLYKELKKYSSELEVTVKERTQELEKLNQELSHLVIIDSLTQISNRRRFDEYLEQEWKRAKREQQFISLILCDVDCFKAYNDHYGHQAGDICLQKIAQAMSREIKRPGDLISRYGGEEFAIILPHTQPQGALALAQELNQAITQLKISHLHSLVNPWVTISLGVSSLIPQDNSTQELLIASADQALYQAKSLGRNRSCLATNYPEMTLSTDRTLV